jgi:hypothetical protein
LYVASSYRRSSTLSTHSEDKDEFRFSKRLLDTPRAAITVEGDSLLVAGREPDRNPIEQVQGCARWLVNLLEATTGKKFAVRGSSYFHPSIAQLQA